MTSVDDTATAAAKKRRSRRYIVATVFLLVSVMLAPLALLSGWAHNELLDTDRYVSNIGPLASLPAVQDAVVEAIMTTLGQSVDVAGLASDLLPSQLDPLAPAVGAGLQRLAETATRELVTSEAFGQLWREANRLAHRQVIALLRNENLPPGITSVAGQIVLDLRPLFDRVVAALRDRGLGFLVDRVTVKRDPTIVLFESSALARAQQFTRLFDKIVWLTQAVTVGAAIVAIAVSDRRRATLLRLGIGLAAGALVAILGLGVARSYYVANVPPELIKNGAGDAFLILTRLLRTALRVALGCGVALALVVWLWGRHDVTAAASGVYRRYHRAIGALAMAGAAVGMVFVEGASAAWYITMAVAALAGLFAFSYERRLSVLPSSN